VCVLPFSLSHTQVSLSLSLSLALPFARALSLSLSHTHTLSLSSLGFSPLVIPTKLSAHAVSFDPLSLLFSSSSLPLSTHLVHSIIKIFLNLLLSCTTQGILQIYTNAMPCVSPYHRATHLVHGIREQNRASEQHWVRRRGNWIDTFCQLARQLHNCWLNISPETTHRATTWTCKHCIPKPY
jgi:hypothetical protein